MANEEKELFKFVNDPKYRLKVIARIHKENDKEYNRRIKQTESEKKKLEINRASEIRRISDGRWEKLYGGKVSVNRTEGKIRIYNTEHPFSSIKGAELNMISGCRIETTSNSVSKSKKHGSLGGAVVGGMVAGPVGAVVAGSALGKTKTKTKGSSVANQIPTCTHLGVLVNMDGFVSEVVFISSQTDQSSMAFSSAQRDAQDFISRLGVLARTPVPSSFLKIEEEASVKAIDAQIASKQQELQTVIADKPVYALPAMYRMAENREMSDDDYINYLESTDAQRISEKQARRRDNAQQKPDSDYSGKAKTVGEVIAKAVFWIISVAYLLFSLPSFATGGGILSGILFSLTAVCVNPLFTGYIKSRGQNIPVWLLIIIAIIGFFAGVYTFPIA